MLVNLCRRHHGVHTPKTTTTVEGKPEDFIKARTETGDVVLHDDAEERLLKLLDGMGFRLPQNPARILLVVGDTAVRNTKIFRRWGKYFDAYALHLEENQ